MPAEQEWGNEQTRRAVLTNGQRSGVGPRLQEMLLHELLGEGPVDLSRARIDGATCKAPEGAK